MLRLVRYAAPWAAALCFVFSASADPLTLLFSESPDKGLGFTTGTLDRPHWGPSSICVSDGIVWVADPVHQRMVSYNPKGTIEKAVALPFPPVRLWCGANNHVWAVDGAWERGVEWKNEVLSAPYPLPHRASDLRTGPGRIPWVVLSDGHGTPIVGKAGLKRAIPLGEAQDGHSIGRKTGANTGEVLIWNWDEPAEVKGQGPARVLAFQTKGKLGSIRPLASDRDGNVYVHLEILSDAIPVAVSNQIVRISRDGQRSRFQWRADGEFAPFEGVVVQRNGPMLHYSIRGNALRIVSVPSSQWAEVQ